MEQGSPSNNKIVKESTVECLYSEMLVEFAEPEDDTRTFAEFTQAKEQQQADKKATGKRNI